MYYRPLLFLFVILGSPLFPALAQKVLWVPMEGTVELGLAPYIQRAVETANRENYELLVLEIDTFGGRVDAAVTIRDALLDSKVKTLAWINKRAISAGALISLACNSIYFSPGGTMGAATPIQMGSESPQSVSKKYISYFKSEMGATAEQNNWPKDIAEAMVQSEKSIPGLVEKGEVLTLTSESALKWKMSNGTAASRDELLRSLNLDSAQVDIFKINWAERLVRFLTEPTVSGLLMSGGILGIILEFQTPGFGLPGILGITCFALFFFGKFLVHLAGWEEVLLLLVGIGLVILEFFVLPGSFFFGTLGFICIFVSLFLAGISPKVPFDLGFPSVTEHVNSLAIAFVSFILGLGILYWTITRFPRKAPLILDESLKDTGQPQALHDQRKQLLGKTGVAMTSLMPSGKIEIDHQIYDAISSAGFIEAGTQIEVTEIDELRIIVRPKGKY